MLNKIRKEDAAVCKTGNEARKSMLRGMRLVALLLVLLFAFGSAASFAAADPLVSIVNPASGGTVYSDSLLVSVKVAKPASIRVSAYQIMKPALSEGGQATSITLEDYNANMALPAADRLSYSYAEVLAPEDVSYTANLSFYTKKLEKITPGVYTIRVDTLDENGNALFSSSSMVGVKDKSEDPALKAQTAQQGGAAAFLKNLLKSIFGE